MSWKFKFESHEAGYSQIYKGGLWCGICAYTDEMATGYYLWWDYDHKKWSNKPKGLRGSHAPYGKCLRSFKRHLRKHPELKGYTVVMCSQYADNSIYAEWSEDNG